MVIATTGTPLRDPCGCVMAVASNGTLVIRDRRHGTNHILRLSVVDLLKQLDPSGTSAVLVS